MATDDFDILYVLEKHGWSNCFIYLGNSETYYMGPTHVFNDPIEELLKALILMLEGNSEVNFSWFDEPGE
jgi:hypothetical protein